MLKYIIFSNILTYYFIINYIIVLNINVFKLLYKIVKIDNSKICYDLYGLNFYYKNIFKIKFFFINNKIHL